MKIEPEVPYIPSPEQVARREAQLAAIRSKTAYLQSTIKNLTAYTHFQRLQRLLEPESKELMLKRGVTKDELNTLKVLVKYYQNRAIHGRKRDSRLEAKRATLLAEITGKVRSTP